ncbi:MAG: hypothetical protein PHE55_06470 [Methylococcaceae bacterium]|nr:hypothetical protein [Methylococcaceae bacterium]
MPMTPEDLQFMEQMVKQLDETIAKLAGQERELADAIGPERVEELRELWDQALARNEELELRRSLDWRDRELLWVWSRQRRAHDARANAGQAYMRANIIAPPNA